MMCGSIMVAHSAKVMYDMGVRQDMLRDTGILAIAAQIIKVMISLIRLVVQNIVHAAIQVFVHIDSQCTMELRHWHRSCGRMPMMGIPVSGPNSPLRSTTPTIYIYIPRITKQMNQVII
jgi:hypothetical protein